MCLITILCHILYFKPLGLFSIGSTVWAEISLRVHGRSIYASTRKYVWEKLLRMLGQCNRAWKFLWALNYAVSSTYYTCLIHCNSQWSWYASKTVVWVKWPMIFHFVSTVSRWLHFQRGIWCIVCLLHYKAWTSWQAYYHVRKFFVASAIPISHSTV